MVQGIEACLLCCCFIQWVRSTSAKLSLKSETNLGSKSKFKTEFDLTQCVRSNSVLNLDLDPSLVSDFRLSGS